MRLPESATVNSLGNHLWQENGQKLWVPGACVDASGNIDPDCPPQVCTECIIDPDRSLTTRQTGSEGTSEGTNPLLWGALGLAGLTALGLLANALFGSSSIGLTPSSESHTPSSDDTQSRMLVEQLGS